MSFKTLHEIGREEIIINKSKFIGYAKPVNDEEEAIEFINEIKKKHSDATHNVYAYVIGKNDNIQRYSDDGEPSGTAGIPILDTIKKEELKNTVVVVTRYFGGIKLGAGGLVRAYIKSAKAGLESAKIVEKKLFQIVMIDIDYNLNGKVENTLLTENYYIENKEYGESVKNFILCEKEKIEDLINLITEITNDNFHYEVKEEKYISTENGEIILK